MRVLRPWAKYDLRRTHKLSALGARAKMAKRKLIFHIGHHKTGSTSIQNAFATGLVRLGDGKIIYPAELNHNYLRPHFNTYLRDGKIIDGRPGRPGLHQIAADLQQQDFDFVVLSGEEFEGIAPRAFQKVLRDLLLSHVNDHAVICYVRPHAGRILSSYAERVKLGIYADTPDAFHSMTAQDSRFSYTKRMTAWRDTFGQRMIIRPMERSQMAEGSLLHDFVQAAFGPDMRVEIDEGQSANESLCLEDLVLLKVIQQQWQHRGRPVRHALGWDLAMALSGQARPDGAGTRLRLHRKLAEDIRAIYLNDARSMDAEFFGGSPVFTDDLDRAVDEAADIAQSFEPSDHFSPDALRGFESMARTIDRMLDNYEGNWVAFLHGLRVGEVHARAPKAQVVQHDQLPQKRLKIPISRKVSLKLLDTPEQLDQAARRLGNVLMKVPRQKITLTPAKLIETMDRADISTELKTEIEEFLALLFFSRNAPLFRGPMRRVPLSAIRLLSRDVAATLDRLSAAGGHVPALTQAGIDYLRGHLIEAYEGFERARLSLIGGGVLRHHNRGLLSLRPLSTFSDWAKSGGPPDLPPISYESDRRFADDLPIVVIGVDGGYYSRYAARIAETAGGLANVHFHIANPGDAEILDGRHLRHSYENAPDANNAYYATMRFLRMPQFLAHYDRPLMAGDADAFFTGSPRPAFDLLGKNDIALTSSNTPDGRRAYLSALPWRKIMAGIFLARPEDGAVDFLRIFSSLYAGVMRENGGVAWWVDQALLCATADLCELEKRPVRIRKDWLFPLSGLKQDKL